MSSRSESKINQILQHWKPGFIATQDWLDSQNVSRQLAARYVQSNWLTRIGSGAYVRNGDSPTLSGAMSALQTQVECPVHFGAETALAMLGFGHYIEMGNSRTMIFGKPGTYLPKWFVNYDWKTEIVYHTTKLFEDDSLGLRDFEANSFPIKLSPPERAILEVLVFVPKTTNVADAFALMNGLTTLRPNLMQELLERCTSVKAKRLALLLAEKSNHSWLERLDTGRINLGRGKRVIGEGGHYYPDAKLSLPISLEFFGENE